MMQTLAAVCITWGFFHAALHPHQVVAAIVLMGAVAMVQRVQSEVSDAPDAFPIDKRNQAKAVG